MPDYSKGKIYKLVSNHTDDVYYGSTCQPLSKRIGDHKKNYNYWKNTGKKYVTSIEITKYGDAEIILVKEYPCENKDQLLRKERKYIEKYECVNNNVPGRTTKEWFQDNKEYRKEKDHDYYLLNQEKIKARVAEYGKKKYTCECGREIILKHKQRHKRLKIHKQLMEEKEN